MQYICWNYSFLLTGIINFFNQQYPMLTPELAYQSVSGKLTRLFQYKTFLYKTSR